MIHAYDELYLSKARNNLGIMLQFAKYDLGIDVAEFYNRFINTGLAERFGKGEPALTVGCSGVELAYEVVRRSSGSECGVKPTHQMDRTPEYWAGWALAYYQWEKNIPFARINDWVPIDEVVEMYHPLHEADILKFVDVMDEKIARLRKESQLARLRAYAGLTQKMLAEKSGVSVRMIEQYEQGKKELSRASGDTIFRLACVLGCRMEDLMV